MSKEAMKQALEALEKITRHFGFKRLGESRLTDTQARGDAHEAITALREALAQQPAQQELDELTAQRDQLAGILTRTANALKDQPAELSQHSWHDLPEVAQQLKAQQEPVGEITAEDMGRPFNAIRINTHFYKEIPPVGTKLYTTPQPLTDELPALPEGKGVVRGPVAAFSQPESGTLVDFDCEGPLSHDPGDGEELFTADQLLEYATAAIKAAHGITGEKK